VSKVTSFRFLTCLFNCSVDDMLLEVNPEVRCFRYIKSVLLLWKPRSYV